ncbi:helix-turn-helix transcriptional regulator [Arenimonas alkanexedens]
MQNQTFPERMALEELQRLHPDTLVNRREAALFLGLTYSTLCHYGVSRPGCGPVFVRLGSKTVRYKMSDLRAYSALKGSR